jgi:serine kinase
MSPEIVKKEAYSGFCADVWALGIILYIMLTERHPFKHKDEKELLSRIVLGQIIPNTTISYDAMRLVTRMLDPVARKRPTAEQIVNDQWLYLQPER